ncbi:hypothetical protein GOBAR_AA15817 [Gossypium barbadense]|uniref:Uncharacterized protein n=1 Tax=Gossypium barbadense TaxID=3634 RepID=A0A2P5XNF2_GOSBA|nr:hypothetical protein GOBAR_AA15817 [Gossypium barbadense]
MPVYCCTRLNGTSVLHARVKETESNLVPGTPVVFYPMPVLFLSSSPTAVGIYRTPCFREIMSCFNTTVSHDRVSSHVWLRLQARPCAWPCGITLWARPS